jgi:uncharacterized protein YdeI (YjbR/CyaY-like superfamily)
VVDAASAARTLVELDAEITLLGGLVELATRVRRAGTDKEVTELRSLLLDEQSMYGPDGTSRGHRGHTQARRFFESLATFYRNGYVRWVEGAKRPATQATRITETVAALRAHQKQE